MSSKDESSTKVVLEANRKVNELESERKRSKDPKRQRTLMIIRRSCG